MKYPIRHTLKRILIKYKLLPYIIPIYFRISEKYPRTKEKDFQKRILNFYSQFIKRGDLCFNIGAYKGNRTEVFLKLGARVVAVEPQERCCEYLQKRTP